MNILMICSVNNAKNIDRCSSGVVFRLAYLIVFTSQRCIDGGG